MFYYYHLKKYNSNEKNLAKSHEMENIQLQVVKMFRISKFERLKTLELKTTLKIPIIKKQIMKNQMFKKQIFKKQIMKQIDDSQIHLYQFPQECEINAKLPFAVVGSNCVLDINGEKIRGRRYPWGVVNVSKLYWKNTFSSFFL